VAADHGVQRLHEPLLDARTPAAASKRLEFAGLSGFEVPGVLVDVDPGAQASRVQFGMELGGVGVQADPERLHRAGGGTSEQDGVARQRADRLFVAGERVERAGQPAQQRVFPALAGQGDRDATGRFAVPPITPSARFAALLATFTLRFARWVRFRSVRLLPSLLRLAVAAGGLGDCDRPPGLAVSAAPIRVGP
jgi:hypothetical protein